MHPRQMVINTREFPIDQVAWAYPIRKAAELMGVSLDTLKRMNRRGSIEFVQEKPGAKKYVKHIDILRYLEEHSTPAKQEAKQ